jgi:hypothetical protein
MMKKIIFAASLAFAAPAFADAPTQAVMDPVVIETAAAQSSSGAGLIVSLVTLVVLAAALD